jgi:hypothetical protein
MNPDPAHRTPSARSPFAGCLILITAVGVMVFLIGFSTLTLFRQADAIAAFTAEAPAPVAVATLEDREAELNSLAERIEKFRQDLDGDEPATLALTAEEINLTVAAYDAFEELRGTFHVETIGDGHIRIAVSFPLNGKPRLARADEGGLIAADIRYLNATMLAVPVLSDNAVALRVEALEVPEKEVPREFVAHFSPYRVTERYTGDPVLGPAMGRLTTATIQGDRIVLGRVPGEKPEDALTDAEVESASQRFFIILGTAASLFLVCAGVILFIGLRAKGKAA